jgi:sugar phosphate isomerase/epimerase
MSCKIRFSVFTKPWKFMPIPQLGELVRGLGFEGIELPVRPGFQVEPEDVEDGLVAAVEQLHHVGVKVFSVAAPIDQKTIIACAKSGVPIIRTIARIDEDEDYVSAEERQRREYDALLPLLEQYGVTIGVQNYFSRLGANAVGLRSLIGKYDPRHVAAVWDAAHEALGGGRPNHALDVIWPHLYMVNLKNAFPQRANGPEAKWAEWKIHWTSGRHGVANWPRVVEELKKRGYDGVVCLTAEYSDHDAVHRLISEDIAFAKSLFE